MKEKFEGFDFIKLNRPSSGEEAKVEPKTPPCSSHDKDYLSNCQERLTEIKKREFSTGAQRDSNTNKPFIHNLLGYTRQRFGYLTNLGAQRYGDGNFKKGIPTEVALESLDRHLASYMEGDRTEDHLAAIVFGAQLCMLNEKTEGISADYYFKLNKKND